MLWPLIIVVLIAILVITWMFFNIEDWSRDLTTNFAATQQEDPDERLRPLKIQDRTIIDVSKMVQNFVREHPLWSFESEQVSSDKAVLHLVRTTPLMRFKDDIMVTVAQSSDPTVLILSATSQSRVGKGDLGQNPRNLRELLEWLRNHSE